MMNQNSVHVRFIRDKIGEPINYNANVKKGEGVVFVEIFIVNLEYLYLLSKMEWVGL